MHSIRESLPSPVHLMGIGGSGMSSLAELLLEMGFQVTGCDRVLSRRIENLISLGIQVWIGHDPSEHLLESRTLVHTAAIPKDHPEIERARAMGLSVLPRAVLLARLSESAPTICVAGSHGKSTVTALTAHILETAGKTPGYLIGAVVLGTSRGGQAGGGDLLVMETDEFDKTIERVSPHLAVITGVEAEHLDVWGSIEKLKLGFSHFAGRAKGGVIAWADGSTGFVPPEMNRRDVLCCGMDEAFDVCGKIVDISEHGIDVHIFLPGGIDLAAMLPLYGKHNLSNAIIASATAFLSGVDCEQIQEGLSTFPGLERRFEVLDKIGETVIISDYAHHPTEVISALHAARDLGNPVLAVFQPHLYSRTARFHEEFAQSLAAADSVIVTTIYPAREPPIPGVTCKLISEAVRDETPSMYVNSFKDLYAELEPLFGSKLTIIFLSAGDLDFFARDLIRRNLG